MCFTKSIKIQNDIYDLCQCKLLIWNATGRLMILCYLVHMPVVSVHETQVLDNRVSFDN